MKAKVKIIVEAAAIVASMLETWIRPGFSRRFRAWSLGHDKARLRALFR